MSTTVYGQLFLTLLAFGFTGAYLFGALYGPVGGPGTVDAASRRARIKVWGHSIIWFVAAMVAVWLAPFIYSTMATFVEVR